jgi:hypothetical protein
MSNASWKNILRALQLAVTACALPALAGFDTFGLGTGRDGALTVSTVNQIINVHAEVTAPLAPGDTTIEVGNDTGFAAGDLVMVLQTTGIVPEPPSGAATALDLSNDPVGRWELARVASVGGRVLRLTQPLLYSYPGRVTQLIRVPEYTTVTLNSDGVLVPRPWNGSVGGVVAFLATGTFTNNGQIFASGRGFRGGQPAEQSDEIGCAGLDEPAPLGAQKGEGIAVTRYGTAATGRGAVANAGAGGVCLKSGGGGGGNGGSGGRGGNTDLSEDGNRAVGGGGGARLIFSPVDHLLMGGGGGAGHSTEVAGGAGGGIVFIRANRMSGTGRIFASGGFGGSATNAGSGGGAGGTIHLRFIESASCGSIQAAGGAGGNSNSSAMGPGGGGGGGRVLLQRGASGTCTLPGSAVIGGPAGNQWDPNAPGGLSYGAIAGTAGGSTLLPGSYIPAPLVMTPANNSSTNDATPVYAGTLVQPYPRDTVVTIYVDGSEVARVAPDASGGWSFTQSESLLNGVHTVYAVASDPTVGSQSSPSNLNIFTVDTMPPAAPTVITPADGSATSDNTPLYSGTAEAGSAVTVLVDGVVVGTVTASVSGAWSLTPVLSLVDGAHEIQARATDAAGNTSAGSDPHVFTVDTKPPPAPSVTTPANGSATNNNWPLFSGTAEAGSTVMVMVDGVGVGIALANASGAWTLMPAVPLADGPHAIQARAADSAGNTSAGSDPHAFTVDTVPPSVPALDTPVNSSTTNNQPIYSGKAEASSVVMIVVDGVVMGTTTVSALGGWTFLQPTLAAGSHTVKVRATDAVGNTSDDSDTHFFTVDTVPPAAPKVSIPASNSIINSDHPLYEGTAEAGSTVTVVVDGVGVGTTTANASGGWLFPQPVALAEVGHTVKARATDKAGNTSDDSDTHFFTVDTVPPVAPRINTTANSALNPDSPWTYSGVGEAGSTVTVVVDGVVVGSTTVHFSGVWSLTPVVPLEEGTHKVWVRATDGASNTSVDSDTFFFTVDTAPPGAPAVTKPSAAIGSNHPVYEGTAEAGSTVMVLVDEAVVGTTTADASGTWSLESSLALAEGNHLVAARCMDAAGNSSGSSDLHPFTVDTLAPEVPWVTVPGASVITQTPPIGGTAEPGSTVTVRLDGEVLASTTADEAGNWSVASDTELDFGTHFISVRASDGAGNASDDSPWYRFAIEKPRSHYGWGCTAAPVFPVTWALVVLGLVFSRRRPRPPTPMGG